ncbi:MAG: zf-HC2 domain-containing protein [Natronosporangium sp.]
MNGQPPAEPADQTCQRVVELVTAYFDDAVAPDQRARIDTHLEQCEGCRNLLTQLRTVVRLTGRLTEADIEGMDPLDRDRITAALRRLRRR